MGWLRQGRVGGGAVRAVGQQRKGVHFPDAVLPHKAQRAVMVRCVAAAAVRVVGNKVAVVDDLAIGVFDGGRVTDSLEVAQVVGVGQQIARIVLEVRVSNEGAIRLYEKQGFSSVGIRRGFYEFPREDARIMVCAL